MRSTLERQLTNAATTLKDAEESARRDRVAAEKKAAERDVEFERLIGHERTTRADVEQRLAQVEEALHEGELKHTLAMRAAATERAERQAQFDAQLAEAADARNTLAHEGHQLKAALDRAQQTIHAHAIDVERLTQREAELTSQLAEAATKRITLEREVTDTATALKDAEDGARRDRLAAETRAAERDVEFERLIGHERTRRADVEQRLAQEIARRDGLDRTIVEMRAAAADAEQRFHDDIATRHRARP
jgi:chromosome segregation ATPase